jgi:hypothetical protein
VGANLDGVWVLVGHVATIEAQSTASPHAASPGAASSGILADASSMHQSSQLTVSENDRVREQQPHFVHLNNKVSSGEGQDGGKKNQRNTKKHIVKVIMLSLTTTTSAEGTTTP